MRELIQRLAEHSTVMLSTHIMQEVDAICDRVLILSDGRLVVDENLSALNQAQRIALVSSAPRQEINQALDGKLEPDDNGNEYFVKLNTTTAVEEQVNAIASKLVNAGVVINSIAPERYDLESLFASVSESGHAE